MTVRSRQESGSKPRRTWARSALRMLVAAALVCTAGAAGAVTRAPTTADHPAAVHVMLAPVGVNGVYHCSGIVLTQHWVLTSAHCLEDLRAATTTVRVERTVLAYVGAKRFAPTNRVVYEGAASFHLNPNFDSIWPWVNANYDLGLIRLQGAGLTAFAPARLYDGLALDVGYDGPLVYHGYGRGTAPGEPSSCASGVGTKRTASYWGSFAPTVTIPNYATVPTMSFRVDDEWSEFCPGDSGGAISIPSTAGPLVLALVSTWMWSTSEDEVTMVRVWLDWIVAETARQGVPITCPTVFIPGDIYRECREAP